MKYVSIGLVAATVLGGALVTGSASAMPPQSPETIQSGAAANIEPVRWVCGAFRCWWEPNYIVERPFYGDGWRHRFFRDRDEWREHHYDRDWHERHW